MTNFLVDTKHPIALDSPDHTHPLGTKRDNSVNQKFNDKLIALWERNHVGTMRVLDIGCAGGGFVHSIWQDGHEAVGIEGSDYCKRTKLHMWNVIPEHLFTADAREPFKVYSMAGEGQRKKKILFDVITIWEFFEHIDGERLGGVFENMRQNLIPGGMVIGTINTMPSTLEVHYHLSSHKPNWWFDRFEAEGFRYRKDLVDYFDADLVRVCTGSFACVWER